MKSFIPFLIIISLLCIIPENAYAIKIRNLDQVEHKVTLAHIGGEIQIVHIKPGEFYYSPSANLQISTQKNITILARLDEEYGIYDGALVLQRRLSLSW